DQSFINKNPRIHEKKTFAIEANFPSFLIDETPVTNLQFYKFLKETRYIPRVTKNFLKHWINGEIPNGKENHPVVYIDLDDARAYASWSGKRLPTEFEWQFAGQGFEKNRYPWGNEMLKNYCN